MEEVTLIVHGQIKWKDPFDNRQRILILHYKDNTGVYEFKTSIRPLFWKDSKLSFSELSFFENKVPPKEKLIKDFAFDLIDDDRVLASGIIV